MSKKCNIIKASIDNLNSVTPLFNSYRLFYGQESNIEQAKSFIQHRLTNNESVIFLATDRNNPTIGMGFIQLYPLFSSVSMEKVWVLNDLYVEKAARKQGVASQLMKRAEEFARESGAISITLETAKDNSPAQHLYESLGYEKEADVYHYTLDTLS